MCACGYQFSQAHAPAFASATGPVRPPHNATSQASHSSTGWWLLLSIGGLGLLIFLLALPGILSPPSRQTGPALRWTTTNSPAYIKSLAVYREGYDGLMIYFVLADANGQPTAASGQLHLEIQDWRGTTDPLYMVSKPFAASEFSRATVGQGPYARETILYSFGRVPYSTFRRLPSDREADIELSVYVSGQRFEARERVLLR